MEPLAEPALEVIDEAPLAMPVELEQVGVPAEARWPIRWSRCIGPAHPVRICQSPDDGRPAWAGEPFECLLFDVAGLTLAVPRYCLGSIYSLAGRELTPLFGQPDWFLGILPSQSGKLNVLDTRWVMPSAIARTFAKACNTLTRCRATNGGWRCIRSSRSLRLHPNEIKWRSQRGQRRGWRAP